jgi:hypothetical protein
MDIDGAEIHVRSLLANYIEGSASPRANPAMAIDCSEGIALRKPPALEGRLDYAGSDGKTFGPNDGPEADSPEPYQFYARCPLRRCLVNQAQGNSSLLLRFILVSVYEIGQYPPSLPGRRAGAPPPNTNTTVVRLPGAYELGVLLGQECVQLVHRLLCGLTGCENIGWGVELEWYSASAFVAANAPGGAFDAFEST